MSGRRWTDARHVICMDSRINCTCVEKGASQPQTVANKSHQRLGNQNKPTDRTHIARRSNGKHQNLETALVTSKMNHNVALLVPCS